MAVKWGYEALNDRGLDMQMKLLLIKAIRLAFQIEMKKASIICAECHV